MALAIYADHIRGRSTSRRRSGCAEDTGRGKQHIILRRSSHSAGPHLSSPWSTEKSSPSSTSLLRTNQVQENRNYMKILIHQSINQIPNQSIMKISISCRYEDISRCVHAPKSHACVQEIPSESGHFTW